jgi:hypothetical protein
MTLTTLPISSERWASEVIFSETDWWRRQFSPWCGGGLHHGAALIGGFGRDAAGAGGALGVVADLADGGGHLLGRGGNLVGLAGLGVALPALWTARALISVVAAESVSAPWATDCRTARMEATLALSASPTLRPISSVFRE